MPVGTASSFIYTNYKDLGGSCIPAPGAPPITALNTYTSLKECVWSGNLPPTKTPTPKPGDCIDTDNGKNYGTRGETYYSGTNSRSFDTCVNANGVSRLTEWFCNTSGVIADVTYTCPGSCLNGACTGIAPTQTPTPKTITL